MSEAKRVPLQTLEFPESLGHAAKKEKKGEKGKQLAPSFRFTVALPESNEKTCPEINYAMLLKAAEKRQRKKQKRGEENTTNGLTPFDDDDDEDELRDMVKRFEAKYGTSTIGKKRHKYDDYVDLGAGYDENDSFIDNTDAYDEIVPEEVTTAHGGFYINCGALEFKAADRHSVLHNNNNNNNNNNHSDDEESSESSEEDTEDVESPKRAEKRNLSSSDEDETEDITGDHPRKKQKVDENGEKKSNHESSNPVKKKKKQQQQPPVQQEQQDDLLNRRKEKAETTDAEAGTASEDQEEKKKTEKTPDPQKSNKNPPEKKFDIKKFEKKASSSSNGYDATKKLEIKKLPPGAKDSNIDDAIESVVNAARVEDESSRDTTDSGKSRCLGTESECEDLDKEEAPLPENLPEDIKEIVGKLKTLASTSKESGKSKFFSTTVNTLLFTLEKKLRTLNPPSVRLQTYAHLARFLPCSKMTLQNRAKKLYLQDAEYRVREPMQRLKTIIDNVMPSVMEKYIKECQKVADEKGFEGSPADAESSDDEENSKNPDKSKIPKRRFPWTDEAKKLVYEIASARRQYFKILRPRKESMESFVAKFMDTKVLPLWPPGCVRLQTLLKYANPSEPVMKKKAKKLKDMVGSNNVASSGMVVCNSRSEGSVANVGSSSQEPRDKPQTSSLAKVQQTVNDSQQVAFSSQGAKSNDGNGEKKPQTFKQKEPKIKESNSGQQQQQQPQQPQQQQQENSTASNNSSSVGKITVVPTAQLMAQKPKSHVEKFNLMDLGNSSLSITPVNDFHKSTVPKITESKKDVVSITAYPEPATILPNSNEVPQTGHHTVHRVVTEPAQYSSSASGQSGYPGSSQAGQASKPVSLKHRLLHENADGKTEKRIEEKELDLVAKTADKRDKRKERCLESKHKQQPDPVKKRKKEQQKVVEQPVGPAVVQEVPVAQPSLSKEEQEQRQNEETIAATNFLSQIINDDAISVRSLNEKRKDQGIAIEETIASIVQPTEQEKDVQMVMRSLKELQELQEMKYSPSHSPVGSSIQKTSKPSAQYTYQEDYQRLYLKKDDKLRAQEEAQW